MLLSHIFLPCIGLIAGLTSGLIAIANAAQQQIRGRFSQSIITIQIRAAFSFLWGGSGSPGRGCVLPGIYLREVSS